MMSKEPVRIAREKRTIRAMIRIYCRGHHGSSGGLCTECAEILGYAEERLDRCPFGADKTACAECTVHCYKPSMRGQIKVVMRYAGPRMIWRHPILAALHILDARRSPGSRARKRRFPPC